MEPTPYPTLGGSGLGGGADPTLRSVQLGEYALLGRLPVLGGRWWQPGLPLPPVRLIPGHGPFPIA